MWTIVMIMLAASWFQDPQRGLQAEAIAFLLSLYSSHKSHLSDPQSCQVHPSLSAFLNAIASAQKHSESLQMHRHPVCHVCSTAKLFRFSRESVNNWKGFLVWFLGLFFGHPYPVFSRIHFTLTICLMPANQFAQKMCPWVLFPRLPAVLLASVSLSLSSFSSINPILDLC